MGFVWGTGSSCAHNSCGNGALLLSRLLELTEAQEGILNIAFRIADEQSYPLFGKYSTPIDRRSAYEILSERAKAAAAEAAMEEEKSDLADDPMQRKFATARRYSGTRVGRSRRVGLEDVGSALGQALVKELKGTTGRRIIRGVLGRYFKGR